MGTEVTAAGVTAELMASIRKAYATPMAADPRIPEHLAKSTFVQSASATSGLTFYDLELGAKFLYPVLTPLRNLIPRVGGGRGIQAAWRAITAINTTGLRIGISAGNRGGLQAITTQDYTASFKAIGIETSVDFEAQYAAKDFDDVRAIAAKIGMESTMLGEEPMLLGGNSSAPLGQPVQPTLVDNGTGGSLLFNQLYSVICVPLTLDALVNGSVVGGIQGAITRLNADGSSDQFGGGSGKQSANKTVTTANDSNSTHSIGATTTAVVGAMGYAWFWSTAAGTEVIGAITPTNSILITAAATGTQTAASLGTADNSTNNLAFDGLLTQALKPGSNAYILTLATGTAGTGTKLTADGYGGIVEIDNALQDRWDNYRLSPDTIWVNSQQARDISTKILNGAANAAQRFVFDASRDSLGGGVMVRTYLNRFSMGGPATLDIKVHPNMPKGVILMTSRTLPYPLSNVGNVMQVRTRQDYYQIEWPLRSRKYEYGVYADEVLQHYFPPSMCVIANIGSG